MRTTVHKLRLWLARRICPPDWRLIEVMFDDDEPPDARTAANDLVLGGDALTRGWGCDPAILYHAAALLRERHET